ncbi:MAG: hypothetical protein KTR29_01205 [Rhodothermaceae bacterium]|nr:hypothetical protein [Rhodothermaceae bacterium]
MSKIIRALLLSAAATGVAAFVVSKMQHSEKNKGLEKAPKDPFEVQAESLTEHEVKQLTDELGNML